MKNSGVYNIIIIDDSLLNCRIFKQILEKCGNFKNIYIADNVISAIQILTKNINDISIIFTDKNMPNINGIECVSIIRKLLYDKLIIGVTGNIDNEDFIESGANYVIEKPVNKNKIIRLIRFINKYGVEVKENKVMQMVNGEIEWI